MKTGSLRALITIGKRLLLATVALGLAGDLFAADAAGDFAAANRLYAEGKFSAAATGYEHLLKTDDGSAKLLFNYGNAEFKAGHLGKAIAAFRRAELLAPRDQEIRANLEYVRNQVQGATVHPPRWQEWLGQLNLNEWTGLTAVAFWLALGLFTVRQLRPALTPRLKGFTTLALLLTLGLGTGLGLQAASHFTQATAVVTTTAATVRSGPFDDAQESFRAHDGNELSILSQHDDWVQVADAQGKIGWLSLKQVQVVPGA